MLWWEEININLFNMSTKNKMSKHITMKIHMKYLPKNKTNQNQTTEKYNKPKI